MKKIQVHAQVGRAENEAAEVLCCSIARVALISRQEAAAIDAQLGGQLAALIQRGEFEGKLGEGCWSIPAGQGQQNGCCWLDWVRKKISVWMRSARRLVLRSNVSVRRK